MGLKLLQQLETRLIANAEVRQSLQILQFGLDDLEGFLKEKLLKNPFLKRKKEIYLRENDNYFPADDFYTEIRKQFCWLSPYERTCCEIILFYIDEQGFLSTSLQEIEEEEHLSCTDLQKAWEIVKRCAPWGVGVRNYQERLLQQLDVLEEKPPLARKILQDYWQEFLKQKSSQIAKKEKIDIQKVEEIFYFLRQHLDPKPIRNFSASLNFNILPSVLVNKKEDAFIVTLVDEENFQLKLSSRYKSIFQSMLKSNKKAGEEEFLKYLQENLLEAQTILKALQSRQETLVRVAQALVQQQREFFLCQSASPSPMSLQDLSNQVQLHKSTISRTLAGKYLACERGLFSLRSFLNSPVVKHGELSEKTLSLWIANLIAAEKGALSDAKIREQLQQKYQVSVSRRTVAKYRARLGFLNSYERHVRLEKEQFLPRSPCL